MAKRQGSPRKTRNLSAEEERNLIKRWRENSDMAAGDALVTAFAPLVTKYALSFRKYGLPLEDLIQEGNLGLLQAAGGFDLDRKVRFGTYAMWWVRAQIQEFVLRNTSIVRPGATRERKSLFFKLRYLQAQMSKERAGAAADTDAIAKMFNVRSGDVEQVEIMLRQGDFPLNAALPSSELEPEGLLSDHRPDPESTAMAQSGRAAQHRHIAQALALLDDREQIIIRSRLLADEPIKLEILGGKLGVSAERVRQIEKKALDKMRKTLSHAAERASDLFIDLVPPAPVAGSSLLSVQQVV